VPRILAVMIAAFGLAALALVAAAAAAPAENRPIDHYLQSLVPEAGHPPAPPAQAAADPVGERLAKDIAGRFGVRVLRAERGESDGKPVYRLLVMNPGGDFDNAFAVHTLVVDAATGELLPQFRHEASGYVPPTPLDRTPRDSGVATTIRRDSFAKP
jgi:hypothetical protein